MELTGQVMALIANVNRDPKRHPTPYSRRDFFKLSYDNKATEIEPDPDMFNKIARTLGSKIKDKASGSEHSSEISG